MFYSDTVLNIKSGKLSLVWLAACNRLKYDKRQDSDFKDVMAVGIDKTCYTIINYFNQKVPSDIGGTQPKFSLYLSAMLMHGTVKIYRRQIKSLLDEATETYKKLQTQSELMQISMLDTSLPKLTRITLKENVDVEVLDLEFGLLTFDTTFPSEVSFAQPTPRKRLRLNKDETLRSEVNINESSLLEQLYNDWTDASPASARQQDITLLDSDVSFRVTPTQPFARQLEFETVEGEFGPPFVLPDVPLAQLPVNVDQALDVTPLDQVPSEAPQQPTTKDTTDDISLVAEKPTKKRTDVSKKQDGDKQPKSKKSKLDAGKITDVPSVEVQEPAVDPGLLNETPSDQQTVPQPLLQRKSSTEPSSAADVTVEAAAPPLPASASTESEINLHPLDQPTTPRRRQRKRRLAIDGVCQISMSDMKEQANSTHDIMRHQSSAEDRVNIFSSKNIIPVTKLLTTICHRRCIAKVLANRLNKACDSRAMSPAREGEGRARRELDFNLNEEKRDADAEDRSLVPPAQINLESSSSLSTPNVSFLHESAMATASDLKAQLQNIQEERNEVDVVPPEIPTENIVPPPVDGDMPPPLTPVLPTRRRSSPDEGIITGTVTAEIHHPPTERNLEDNMPVIEPVEQPPLPERVSPLNRGSESLTSSNSFASNSVLSMPYSETSWRESIRNRQNSFLQNLEDYRGITMTFEQLLPPGATKFNAATTFYDLLCLHKTRDVKLYQEENYGTIKVEVS